MEFKILEKLFTEEEAEMFLYLSLKAETPEDVAQRIGHDPEVVAAILHKMSEKGTVFPLCRDDTAKYGAMPYILGIWEYQAENQRRKPPATGG